MARANAAGCSLAWAMTLAYGVGGCTQLNAFHCATDQSCSATTGASEVCVQGLCATHDPGCQSGLRYDDTAGGQSDQCAPGGREAAVSDGSVRDRATAGEGRRGDATPAPADAAAGPWTLEAPPTMYSLLAVGGTSASDVWAVGSNDTKLHWNGSTWSRSATLSGDTLLGVSAAGASEAWAVGGLSATTSTAEHLAMGWAINTPPGAGCNELRAVWDHSAADVWAVGLRGTVFQWNGLTWTTKTAPTGAALYAVWGASPSAVWIAGGSGGSCASGIILHWDGTSFTTAAPPSGEGLHGVWGSSASDVWAAGGTAAGLTRGGLGFLYHWNGSAWSAPPLPPVAETLRAVWASGPADAWAVGDGGTILRWDGASWLLETSPTTNDLYGVWGSGGTSSDGLWAVGVSGTVLYRAHP